MKPYNIRTLFIKASFIAGILMPGILSAAPACALPVTAAASAAPSGILLIEAGASAPIGIEGGTQIFSVGYLGSGSMPWTAEVVSGGEWARIVSGANGINSGTITVVCDLLPPPYPDPYAPYDPDAPPSSRTAEIRITAGNAVNSPEIRYITQSVGLTLVSGPYGFAKGFLLGEYVDRVGYRIIFGNGSPPLHSIAIAPDGSLYDAYAFSVRKIIPSGNAGAFFTLAGQAMFSGAKDGFGTSARFGGLDGYFLDGGPVGITLAGNGLIVLDSIAGHNVLRRIDLATHEVTTLVDTYGKPGGWMAFSVESSVSVSGGCLGGIIAASADGKIVYTTGNNCVLKITLTGTGNQTRGVVSTLAGQEGVVGTNDGAGTGARFGGSFMGLAMSPVSGDIYLVEGRRDSIYSAYGVVRKITKAGVVTTLSGTIRNLGFGLTAEVSSSAFPIQVHFPRVGIAVDDASNLLYVASGGAIYACDLNDGGSAFVRMAGHDSETGFRDGFAGEARFGGLSDLVLAANGDLYMTDAGNRAIRKYSAGGMVTTLQLTATTMPDAGGTGGGGNNNNSGGTGGDGGGGGAASVPALALFAALLAARAFCVRKK